MTTGLSCCAAFLFDAVACLRRDSVRFALFPPLTSSARSRKMAARIMSATLLPLQTSNSLCIAISLPDCGICQPVSGLHRCFE